VKYRNDLSEDRTRKKLFVCQHNITTPWTVSYETHSFHYDHPIADLIQNPETPQLWWIQDLKWITEYTCQNAIFTACTTALLFVPTPVSAGPCIVCCHSGRSWPGIIHYKWKTNEEFKLQISGSMADMPCSRRPVKLSTDAKASIDQMCKNGEIKSP